MGENLLGLTPTQACNATFTGLGGAFGLMTGRVGGTTTMLLGLVGGAAVGFVIGRCVCRFSLFQRLFEKKLKYLEFEQALNAKENRDPIVAGLSDEFGLTPTQADALLTQRGAEDGDGSLLETQGIPRSGQSPPHRRRQPRTCPADALALRERRLATAHSPRG
jgi:hypothetical protein